ncbi:ABC transporter ATP-binding protein [Hydrogenimonas cancrithermarum]|uniref:ABC transporter ATP-binding protein n=1 Tax=Hydrogenimonas cancrithermarum TaxID=2993563 RepID=A0ABN6WSQ5_9BACT|nr:ATP-binding cassette domain-containing protein [Hydrogenimonas cancrithermarum]BDY12094.1 ABC transporter ATP-binding protein [Hydrogenimonas cancrithermarum]
MKREIIVMRGIETRFGTKVVHEDVNLTIYEGEIYGLLGGSGSGKTTLLREMIMLLRPSKGFVKVLGYDLSRITRAEAQKLRSEWGVLFQFGALFTSLTVAENIAVWLREYTDLSEDTIRKIILSKLDMVGLSPDVGKLYPSELSGGMIKRAALARALVMDPKLLFLDEPTSGLDPVSAEAFDDLVTDLRELLGLTIVMVTHDIDTIFNVVDRMAILGDRHVVAEGSLKEILQTDHPFIRQFFGGNRAKARIKVMEMEA